METATPVAPIAAPVETPNEVAASEKPTQGIPGQSATKSAAEKAEAPKPPQHIEFEGKKYSAQELKAKLALAEGAYQKFESAAQERKKIEAIQQRFDADPLEATIMYFESKGLPRNEAEAMARSKFEKSYKTRFIDPEGMTPEQREAAQYKKELEDTKAKLKERDDADAKVAADKEGQAVRESMQKEIIDVIEKSGMPKTRFTANRVAFWMRQNLANGYDAPPEVITQQVKDEGKSIITSMLGESTPDQMVEMLGEDIIKKLRTYDLSRLQKRFGENQPNTEKTPRTPTKKGTSMADVDEYLNSIRRSPVTRRS